MSEYFQFYDHHFIQAHVKKRAGEKKIGESLPVITALSELKDHPAKYILLGVPEDIGVRANYGTGGAHTAWEATWQTFVNIQDNGYIRATELSIMGHLKADDLMKKAEGKKTEELREIVEEIDERLYPVIREIKEAGKIPVIVGGGHNNSFPILKGVSMAAGSPLNVINLDAHADLRAMEGRHSGNGFSYAIHHQFLEKYYMIGLHQNYNSDFILESIKENKNLHTFFFEDIFLHGSYPFEYLLKQVSESLSGSPVGIELDLDAIENILSSACSPVGFSVLQARKYVHHIASASHPAYLHICEGATVLSDGRKNEIVGKLIAYLISDFIKACQNK